jgi:hypothetical protein
MYVCVHVRVRVRARARARVRVRACVRACVCFLNLFIKHAPSPGSDTTCYNVTSY